MGFKMHRRLLGSCSFQIWYASREKTSGQYYINVFPCDPIVIDYNSRCKREMTIAVLQLTVDLLYSWSCLHAFYTALRIYMLSLIIVYAAVYTIMYICVYNRKQRNDSLWPDV